MTSSQIGLMKRLWADGVSAKQIAYAVGCTEQYVHLIAMNNRESFPRRHRKTPHVSPDTRAALVGRVKQGELSMRGAARECGVAFGTMRKWVLAEGANDGRRSSH